jgi:hypothetical protein
LLKQAILEEADNFLKIQKINSNNEINQANEQKSTLETNLLTLKEVSI